MVVRLLQVFVRALFILWEVTDTTHICTLVWICSRSPMQLLFEPRRFNKKAHALTRLRMRSLIRAWHVQFAYNRRQLLSLRRKTTCKYNLQASGTLQDTLSLVLWVEFSVDDILKYFSYFSQKSRFWHFMQIVSNGGSLNEMSYPVFWENKKKYHQFVVCWTSPESGKGYATLCISVGRLHRPQLEIRPCFKV